MFRRQKIWSSIAGLTMSAAFCVLAPQSGFAANQPGDAGGLSFTYRAKTAPLDEISIKGVAEAREQTPEVIHDLELYSKQTNQDPISVKSKYSGIDEFEELATSLEVSNKDYVGAGYNVDGGGIWIKFKTRPADSVLHDIAELPYNTKVQFGAPLAFRKLDELQELMFIALSNFPDAIQAGSSIDPYTSAVNLTYSSKEGASIDITSLRKKLLEVATSFLGQEVIPVDVTLTFDPSRETGAYALIKGGHDMRISGHALNDCTSGFTVRINGTTNGVATAMHCPNGMLLDQQSGVVTYENAATPDSSTAYIDLQWHSTIPGNSTTTSFRYDTNSERNVLNSQNAVVGSVTCGYGLGTGGARCSNVFRTQVCYQPEDLRFCGLAAMNADIFTFGDSGGPMYLGNTAEGFTSGYATIDNIRRGLFTPQTRVAQNLNGVIRV